MGHLLPRKIKKACNPYLYNVPLKTKWMRHVHCQVSGFHYVTVNDYSPIMDYYTKYGAVINYMLMKLG